jgi:hypothetical protein
MTAKEAYIAAHDRKTAKEATLPAFPRRAASALGQSMPEALQQKMEGAFGADFSDVRIHAGSTRAMELGARAYTQGSDIHVAPGQPANDTRQGQELLGHELTHVVQQRAGRVQATTQMKGVAVNAERGLEAEADAMGARTADGLQQRGSAAIQRSAAPAVSQLATAVVQRWELFEVASKARDFFAEQANLIPGFRMLTVILGMNPINMKAVERSAANILRAVVGLMVGGELIIQALDHFGVFDRVGAWIEQQIRSLGLTWESIKQAIDRFIDSLGVSDLANLGGVWNRAVSIFAEPINRISSFVRGLVPPVLRFIKEAILTPLSKLAASTKGWDLLTAVLGKDPITGEAVPRTAETLIGGFMKLIGQQEIWENIKRANAGPRAMAWFQKALSGLLGFVNAIPGLFVKALEALTVEDVVLLPRALAKVAVAFGDFLGKFFDWAGGTIWNLLEIIFEVVAPEVLVYLHKAGGAFRTILKDPVHFVGNLVKAGQLGLQQFAANFVKHLRASLIGWLTGTLGGAGIYIPQAFTLVEIGKLVLSVLGITWPKIRAKIVKVIGEPAMKTLETGFDIVVALVKGGPAAAWEVIKEQLSNLHEMVMQSIIGFVQERVVQAAITKLVSMLSPAGAFIQAIIATYNTVMFFVERLKQIAQVVAAFIDSIAAIASGALGAAANRVEQTMAGLLTLVVSFLARIAGLGSVTDAVTKLVAEVQGRVDKALDFAISWIVEKAKSLLAGSMGKKDTKDERTEEQKLADLRHAMSEGAAALKGTSSTAKVRKLLTSIQAKYNLTSLVLVTDKKIGKKETDHIEGTINPEIKGDPEDFVEGLVDAETGNPISIDFSAKRFPSKEKEYREQIAMQQTTLRAMKISEWSGNRNAFIERREAARAAGKKVTGRDPQSAKLQEDFRENQRLLMIDAKTTLYEETMSPKAASLRAKKEVDEYMKDKAALHPLDQVAGGGAEPTELGDTEINSAIGPAWNSSKRIGRLDKAVAKVPEDVRGDWNMDVTLTVDEQG